VLRTPAGVIIWDASTYVAPVTLTQVAAMCSSSAPFLGIAISHPHFYNAFATLLYALIELLPPNHAAPSACVFASARDCEWWTRTDVGDEYLEWVKEDTRVLAPGITFVRCGGHFPGSAVLYWDRAIGASADGGPRSGVLLCSDTVMIGPDRRAVSFMWSVPNLVRFTLLPSRASHSHRTMQLPLSGVDVQNIAAALGPYQFEDAYSAWPDRELAGDAKGMVLMGARRFVQMEGWAPEQIDI
jgi:hypothetical protein